MNYAQSEGMIIYKFSLLGVIKFPVNAYGKYTILS